MLFKKIITTCPLDCFDACSLEVTVDSEGKIIEIEGNKEHPITRGFICEKGKKHLERVYHPDRLKYPMVKEEGQWKRISWDEAYNILASRMKNYMDSYGSESIAVYNYAGAAGILKNIEDIFFDYVGGMTTFYGSVCWGAGMAAQKLDFGRVLSHKPEDILNSKTVVIWGRNPVETNIHLVPYIKAAKKNGAEVIVVDPIKSASANIADRHMAVKPEGDAVLACAVAKYLIEKENYDKDFMNNYTKGFESLEKYLKEASMPELSKLCGISQKEIAEFAERIAGCGPTSIYIGYGLQRYTYGGIAVRAIDMLAALTGNIGKPGGGANYANTVGDGYIAYNIVKSRSNRPHRLVSRAMFGKAVKSLAEPPVKMLFVSRTNPVLQLPNTNEVIEAFKGIEFKVVLDHFINDTVGMADMVLPVTYFLEEEDVIVPGMWNSYVGKVEKCKDRYFEAKPEYEIYTELAERLGYGDFPKFTEREWLNMLLKPLADNGLDLKELNEKGFTKNPMAQDIPWQDKKFDTASGKFELLEPYALNECLKAVGEKQKNKYRLLTVHQRKSMHSQHMMDTADKFPRVFVNPRDAKEENISNNDVVRIFNTYGEIQARVTISDQAGPGILWMNEGWWLKNGGSVNNLTEDSVSDIGNQGVMNHCFCSIEKG